MRDHSRRTMEVNLGMLEGTKRSAREAYAGPFEIDLVSLFLQFCNSIFKV